ncbi:MAG: RidA family protein [Alphaproteobacteria bacterium]|nr:RidA family protein [Alphaproteobacteria bacterium]MBU0795821.1 RidA family protein [Alphaproteobacteria bacterium]MBU0886683.1 RidA family protein [Alphaproteobacteria bacterium]MBU1814538.1 RidA family protein [Alphaproteobacteria bacterium]MBU2091537.1 RidA family protein [Alphaproteobacteria bacterium]
MLTKRNPKGVPQPASKYAQMVEGGGNLRWLHISGQIGVTAEGTVLDGFEAQCEQTFRNIITCLEAAGMGIEDLVKITVLMTRQSDVPAYRGIRDRMLNGIETASTLMVVAGLASPAFLIEIEAVAAKG